MSDLILVLNAGSSSVKFSLFPLADGAECLFRGQIEALGSQPKFAVHDAAGTLVDERRWQAGERFGHAEAIQFLLGWIAGRQTGGHRVVVAGHRVVHGGRQYSAPVWIDGSVLASLKDLVPLAPLHQPHNVAAIEAVSAHAPHLPQVACFDTAFHRTQPRVAETFGLPRRLTDEGICRYGFHGLSYEYIASQLPRIDANAAAGRTVVAHLGNGASLCALRAGRSIGTTMGLTALDGLVMGTRCGAIDPGVLLYLLDRHGMDVRALQQMLYEESGLLGVSTIASDMRTLLSSPDPRAAEAVDLFVYRVVRELGSLAAALEGIDAVVFAGGIGENAAAIRGRVCVGAAWLGIELDEAANAAGRACISRPGSRVAAWIVPTNEELMIADHARRLLHERKTASSGR